MNILTAGQVVTLARSLGRLQRDCGLPVDPEENIKLNLNFGLVDVVYEWARGVPFCEITQVTVTHGGLSCLVPFRNSQQSDRYLFILVRPR